MRILDSIPRPATLANLYYQLLDQIKTITRLCGEDDYRLPMLRGRAVDLKRRVDKAARSSRNHDPAKHQDPRTKL